MFGFRVRTFVHFKISDGFSLAISRSLLGAAPVNVEFVPFVANVRVTFDYELWIAALACHELYIKVLLKINLMSALWCVSFKVEHLESCKESKNN